MGYVFSQCLLSVLVKGYKIYFKKDKIITVDSHHDAI